MTWLDIKYFIHRYQIGTYIFLSLLILIGIGLIAYGSYSISKKVYVVNANVQNINCEGDKCSMRLSYIDPIKNEHEEIFFKVTIDRQFKVGDVIKIGIYKDKPDDIFLYNKNEQLFNSIPLIIVGCFLLLSIIFVWWKSTSI